MPVFMDGPVCVCVLENILLIFPSISNDVDEVATEDISTGPKRFTPSFLSNIEHITRLQYTIGIENILWFCDEYWI